MYKDKRLSWDWGSITVGNEGKRSVSVEVDHKGPEIHERLTIRVTYSITEMREVINLLEEYLKKAKESP